MDLTQLPGNLPPAVTNVLQQVQAGKHAAVPDAQARYAYNHVAGQLTAEEFQRVAADAYRQLSPDQRSQLADEMRTEGLSSGIDISSLPSATAAASDPATLANATADLRSQRPDLVHRLLAPGGVFSSPIAKVALLGITALAAQRLTEQR